MRIRLGFVSNSSSVSFCIYGIWIDYPKQDIKDIAEKIGLFCHGGQDGDGLYIGRKWSSIKDDETGKDFKISVEQMIDKLKVENEEYYTYEKGWYDG